MGADPRSLRHRQLPVDIGLQKQLRLAAPRLGARSLGLVPSHPIRLAPILLHHGAAPFAASPRLRRARQRRDITVPTGTAVIVAISL